MQHDKNSFFFLSHMNTNALHVLTRRLTWFPAQVHTPMHYGFLLLSFFFLHIFTDRTLYLHGNISRYMTRTDFGAAGRDGERETEYDHSGVRDKPRVKVAGDG